MLKFQERQNFYLMDLCLAKIELSLATEFFKMTWDTKFGSSDTGSSGIPSYAFSISFRKGHKVLLN